MALDIDGLGGLHGAVRKTLGINGTVRHCAAVLFDRGGDDGYWIRTLPLKSVKYRRCGLLVVTEEGVAYAELCATRPRPATGVGFMTRLAVHGKGNWAYYTWVARKGEITDVSVQHVEHSPYGGYASVTITANGQRRRFGLSEGEPSVLSCVSAIRYLAGASLSLAGATRRPPRTDGIYVIGAEQLVRPFRFIHFDESSFVLRNSGMVRTDLDAILAAGRELQRVPYRWDGHTYLSDEAPSGQKAFAVSDDGRLVFDYLCDRGKSPEFGDRVFDLAFVPFDEIGRKWGEPALPGPWPTPDWEPVLTSAGEIEAADIGQVATLRIAYHSRQTYCMIYGSIFRLRKIRSAPAQENFPDREMFHDNARLKARPVHAAEFPGCTGTAGGPVRRAATDSGTATDNGARPPLRSRPGKPPGTGPRVGGNSGVRGGRRRASVSRWPARWRPGRGPRALRRGAG